MTQVGALLRVALVPLALTAMCAVIASITGRDPMLIVELAALLLIGAWLLNVSRALRQAMTDAARLAAASQPFEVAGTDVRLLDTSSPAAFVSGLLRPQIYLSTSLVGLLDRQELRGVLFHEHHHRRTRAPLRALALDGWLRALRWVPPAREALTTRLAALEIEADAAAVARGVAPATLASALLKCDTHLPAAASAFSAASEIRIDELVAWSRDQSVERRLSIPVEWAAPATAAIALWACHLIGA